MSAPRAAVLASILGVLVLAGCHEPVDEAPDPSTEWQLHGTFSENVTQEDMDDLESHLATFDAELFVMETFPLQYRIDGPDDGDCETVRVHLETLTYVTEVGQCFVASGGP